MVKDLNIDMEIIVGPIIREQDGLALSSRNSYLSAEERKDALSLNSALQTAAKLIWDGELDAQKLKAEMRGIIEPKNSIRIDYISIIHPDTLEDLTVIEDRALIALAVFVGKTKLIDNQYIEI